MSQEKVDRYKEQKKNRKKIMKQENQFHNILKKTLESLLNYITELTLIIL